MRPKRHKTVLESSCQALKLSPLFLEPAHKNNFFSTYISKFLVTLIKLAPWQRCILSFFGSSFYKQVWYKKKLTGFRNISTKMVMSFFFFQLDFSHTPIRSTLAWHFELIAVYLEHIYLWYTPEQGSQIYLHECDWIIISEINCELAVESFIPQSYTKFPKTRYLTNYRF